MDDRPQSGLWIGVAGAAAAALVAAIWWLADGASGALEVERRAPRPGAPEALEQLRLVAAQEGGRAPARAGSSNSSPGPEPEPADEAPRVEAPEQPGPHEDSYREDVSGNFRRVFDADGQLESESYGYRDETDQWVRNGPWKLWHPNGQLEELGAYAEDAEDGPWEWWYANGERQASGLFDRGKREGDWRFWHENGERMLDAFYVNGVGAGTWTLYHENGVRATSGRFENGQPHGTWTVWKEDGSIDHGASLDAAELRFDG